MKFVALLLVALVAAGCGPADAPSPPRAVAPQTSLSDLARELVPASARGSLLSGELRVAECGITPTYPCVTASFLLEGRETLDARLSGLRRVATSAGWRIDRVQRFESGAHVDLVQRRLHARYTLGRDIFGPGAMVQLSVFGPAKRLPRPTDAQRAAWTDAKRAYVREANALCRQTLGRLRTPDDVAPMVSTLAERLRALEPPPGDERAVQAFLRPLSRLARAARALSEAKDESALPAAVGVGEFTKRFVEAASRFGLADCALG